MFALGFRGFCVPHSGKMHSLKYVVEILYAIIYSNQKEEAGTKGVHQ